VAYSRTSAPSAPHHEYAAHFWLEVPEEYRRDPRPLGSPADAFHAIGHEGQFVTIIPSRRPSPKLNPARWPLIFVAKHHKIGRVLEMIFILVRAFALACRGHHELVLENIALRQQLNALKRTAKRPRLRTLDRVFWILWFANIRSAGSLLILRSIALQDRSCWPGSSSCSERSR
jgi:hypothetical protein